MSNRYKREQAVAYAEKWALKRNPKYFNFEEFGGDCTNFISQCIFAGIGQMNYTPNTGWYYRSSYDRTPSWSGVGFLHEFLVHNKGAGPRGTEVSRQEIKIGDVIQLAQTGRDFTHSLFVCEIVGFQIFICTHTYDSFRRPLDSYTYDRIRYIRIE